MARQVLPVFWMPSDVDDLKRRIREAVTGTDLGVQACAGLADSTRAAWGIFYASALEFSRSSTGIFGLGTEANRGEEIEDELYAWQTKLAAAGCNAGAPAVNPQPAEAPGSSLVRWVAVAAIAIAGAYVAHEVAATLREVLPREPAG